MITTIPNVPIISSPMVAATENNITTILSELSPMAPLASPFDSSLLSLKSFSFSIDVLPE